MSDRQDTLIHCLFRVVEVLADDYLRRHPDADYRIRRDLGHVRDQFDPAGVRDDGEGADVLAIEEAGPAPLRVVAGDDPEAILAAVIRALTLLHEAIAQVGPAAYRGVPEASADRARFDASLDVAAEAIQAAGILLEGR